MIHNSASLDPFLRDIVSTHYSEELVTVFSEPLSKALSGTSLFVVNKTTYNSAICYTLPIVAQAHNNPQRIQLVLSSTAKESHALMNTIAPIAKKLAISTKEILEPAPGDAPLAFEQFPSILVGTLKTFFVQKRIQPEIMNRIDTIILESVDIMLNLGYGEEIKLLLKTQGIKQYMLFSKTESTIASLTSLPACTIEKIILEDTKITPESIPQALYHVAKQEKIPLLLQILAKETSTIIVCNTKGTAEYVYKKLQANNIAAGLLLSHIDKKEQNEYCAAFKDGKLAALVTNDKSLERSRLTAPCIISYDLPLSPLAYKLRLHHINVNTEHKAISFACEEYVYNLPIIEQELGFKIPVQELVPSMLKKDTAAASYEHRRSRNYNKSNYQRSSNNDDYIRTAGKHSENKNSARTHKSENHKKHSYAHSQTEHITERHDQNLDTSLYTMSAEERLKYYQEKYSKKFNKEKTESSPAKTKKPHVNGRPTNTTETQRSDKQPKTHTAYRYQNSNNNQRSNNAAKQTKPTDNRKQKSSVMHNLLTSISNLFKPKTNNKKHKNTNN